MRIVINALFVFGLIIATNICAYPDAIDSTIVVEEDVITVDTEKMPWELVDEGFPEMPVIRPEAMQQPKVIPQPEEVVKQVEEVIEQQGVVMSSGAGVTDEAVLAAEKLDGRLVELEQKNEMMNNYLVDLNMRLAKVEKSVAKSEKAEQVSKDSFYGKIEGYMDRLKERLGPKLFIITISSIVLALLALLLYLIIPRRKVVSNVSYPRDESVSDKEYNATYTEENEGGEEETTESKLNLARAYVEMGGVDKAKPMLIEILSHGTDEEQEEAKELLDKIKYGDDV